MGETISVRRDNGEQIDVKSGSEREGIGKKPPRCQIVLGKSNRPATTKIEN